MPKLTFEIPADRKNIIRRHEEVNWNKVVNKAIWNYAKKIKIWKTSELMSYLKKRG
jgi:hypothetical protein